jgi:hypothetical protein
MLDILFTTGQAASVMLLLYGAFLTLMPVRKALKPDPMPEDLTFMPRQLQNDA